MKDTYSIDETCEILGVGRNTVYEALRRNELPKIKVGRWVVIPKAALDRLVKDGQPGWAKNAWDATTIEHMIQHQRLSEFLDQFVDELETQLPRYADRADDLNDLIGHTRLVADLMRQIETAIQPN